MTIKELLTKAYSKKLNIDNTEVDKLLALALHKKIEYVYKNTEKELNRSNILTFNKYIRKRLENYSFAHIAKYKEFYNKKFLVNSHTLIPRPDSELLVDITLNYLKKNNLNNPNIIDIGTGTGCLILSIANNYNKANYYATDISNKVLKIAKTNKRKLKIKNNIKFIQSNLLNNVKNTKFDIIISNLPYLTKEQMKENSIQKEPKIALLGYKDGLEYYNKLLKQIENYLKEKYLILLEIDPKQKNKIEKIIQKYLPKSKIQFHKDLQNNTRVVEIK